MQVSYLSATTNKLGESVTADELQVELDNIVGANKTVTTTNVDGTLNVKFYDTEHNYNVNQGNVIASATGGGTLEEQLKAILEQQTGDCTIDEYGTIGDLSDWNYELIDDTSCRFTGERYTYCSGIAGYYGEETVVVVPMYIKNEEKIYRVTDIGEGLFARTNVVKVEIPEGIESLGDATFSNCEYLEALTLPESLKSVGEACFCCNYVLEELRFPKNVEVFGADALYCNVSVKRVYFEFLNPPAWGAYCFYGTYEGVTFYFKKSEVADSFASDYYNTAYGVKSDNYDW